MKYFLESKEHGIFCGFSYENGITIPFYVNDEKYQPTHVSVFPDEETAIGFAKQNLVGMFRARPIECKEKYASYMHFLKSGYVELAEPLFSNMETSETIH
jgi:hypothetical protein